MMWDWLKTILVDNEQVRSNRELAERGENLAARHLQGKGYKILLRNFRTETGEIDVIARDGKTLVFVEVKTRDNNTVEPEEQVNEHKQQQITRVARTYLSRYGIPQPPYRYDIVAITWPTGHGPDIKHMPNAFGE